MAEVPVTIGGRSKSAVGKRNPKVVCPKWDVNFLGSVDRRDVSSPG